VKFSVRQMLASSAGAVVAAAIASFFGVKGTIVGVAIGSAAATVGTALVAQSIDRTHHAVRQVVVRAPESSLLHRLGGTDAARAESVTAVDTPVAVGVTSNEVPADETAVTEPAPPGPPTATLPGGAAAQTRRDLNWRVVAVTALIVFLLAILVITAVELIAGKPLADLFGGSSHGSGTTFFGGSTGRTQPPTTTTTTVPAPSTTTTSAGATTSTTGVATTTTTAAPTTATSGPTTSTSGSTTTTRAAG
jgi:hypothetical protein